MAGDEQSAVILKFGTISRQLWIRTEPNWARTSCICIFLTSI
jgi:hypothetical protein